MSVHPPSAALLACPHRHGRLRAASSLWSALRRVSRRAWQQGFWGIALLLAGWAAPAQADTQWLRQAQTLTETRPQTPATPPTDWTAARSIALPDEWPAERAGPAGVVWYRSLLDRPATGDASATAAADTVLYGLYVERACSVLQVWLNGLLDGR